ncbi:MAG: hypothetical protein IJA55_02070 [Clostridia bacterium]|nr:hypothetical protein [Clostridia bacterium]
MDKPIEFRSRGRGYDKNDVNEFISRENIRFNKLEEEYNKTIREQEKSIEDLNKQLSESEEKKLQIVNLEIENSTLKDKIGVLESEIAEKDTIIDGLKTAVDSANEKLELANSIIDDFNSKALTADSESVDEPVPEPEPEPIRVEASVSTAYYDDSVIDKAIKYDAICDNIDEIFAFAKEEADKIIAEAIEIRKQAAKRSPNQVKNELSARSKSIIGEIRDNFRRQLMK